MIVDNEEYINTQEAVDLLNTSKQSFYAHARSLLQTYHFNAKRTPWYKKSDVLALKGGKSLQRGVITISGILKDWTEYVRSLGMNAATLNAEIVTTTLPDTAVKIFNLDASQQFAKRSRLTLVDGAYICVWDTYYPMELVKDDYHKIQHDFEYHVVDGIKARHGLTIGYTRERYRARSATFREQQQMHLVSDDPILDLKRVSYTRDRKTLILYSDMALLGNWFAAEREDEVKIWDE